MEKTSRMYRFIRNSVKFCYKKISVEGQEHLPGGPVIIVGNHCKMNGPIAAELYVPGPHYTWCAAEMMHREEVPEYAYRDFWAEKPKGLRWFYRGLSHLIAPLSELVFTNANTIGVYHDSRILTTLKTTVKRLEEGSAIVIFPEHDAPYNDILNDFQTGFVDVARLYYKRTGKVVSFVPMYLAPALKTMYFGEPVSYCPENPIEEERTRICGCLMARITAMARSLPRHRVVPYKNVPKKDYPYNLPEEKSYETACG